MTRVPTPTHAASAEVASVAVSVIGSVERRKYTLRFRQGSSDRLRTVPPIRTRPRSGTSLGVSRSITTRSGSIDGAVVPGSLGLGSLGLGSPALGSLGLGSLGLGRGSVGAV